MPFWYRRRANRSVVLNAVTRSLSASSRSRAFACATSASRFERVFVDRSGALSEQHGKGVFLLRTLQLEDRQQRAFSRDVRLELAVIEFGDVAYVEALLLHAQSLAAGGERAPGGS